MTEVESKPRSFASDGNISAVHVGDTPRWERRTPPKIGLIMWFLR